MFSPNLPHRALARIKRGDREEDFGFTGVVYLYPALHINPKAALSFPEESRGKCNPIKKKMVAGRLRKDGIWTGLALPLGKLRQAPQATDFGCHDRAAIADYLINLFIFK